MASRYGSLYDAYRLDNSRVIPLYTGSTAPEALQVGQYNQQLYDQAQTGAFGINNGLQGITSLPQDKVLADNLRSNVQQRLRSMAERGDYENMIPEVQQLGSEFTNRYRELIAPMQQRQEFQKQLDDKEYNLTSDQKAGILAMSDAGYSGLRKDEYGRYTGRYSGAAYDKNIDLNKWIDERMKDIAVQKGGSEVANDNGEWKIKRGSKWERLAPGTIESALSSAMSNYADYQGYKGMMGRIAGFRASRLNIDAIPDAITSVDAQGKPIQVANPVKQQIQQIAAKYGISPRDAATIVARQTTEQGIESNALNYARTKYAVNNQWSESGQSIGDFQVKRYEKMLKDEGTDGPGIFGDLVTGQGIDLSQKYGDANKLAATIENTAGSVTAAETYIDSQKNRMARASGLKPSGAKGNYTKADLDKISDTQVSAWFSQNDPQELGRYQSNKNIISGAKEQVVEMNQVRDAAMDAAVKKATGGQRTYNQLKDSATDNFHTLFNEGKLGGLKNAATRQSADVPGQHNIYQDAGITKDNINDWEVIDGDRSSYGNTTVTVRNRKTGSSMEVLQQGSLGKDIPEFRRLAGNFDGINWKNEYKAGVQGLRSNMTWMPLLNRTTPDGETTKSGAYAMRAEGLLRAAAGSGALRLTDNNDSALGKDDETNYKSLIAAGQYQLLGIGIDPKSGQRRAMVNIVVDKEASDPSDRYKTVMIGADTNFWDRMASSVQQTAARDLNSQNAPTRAAATKDLQFGLGLQTGSGYSNISSMLAGHSRTIKDATGNSEYKIVASPTGDGSNALMYYLYKTNTDGTLTTQPPIPFNSSLDLGAYIDMQRADGKILTK